MGKPQAQQLTKKFRKPNLLRFLREIGLRFVVNASRALLKKHHLFSETSWCNSSTFWLLIRRLRDQITSGSVDFLLAMKCSNMKMPFRYRIDLDFYIQAFFFWRYERLKKMETWMPKFKPISFEPELNQRPKDSQHIIYSTPLYQLSYRRIGPQQHTKEEILESLTSWVFWGKSAAFLW